MALKFHLRLKLCFGAYSENIWNVSFLSRRKTSTWRNRRSYSPYKSMGRPGVQSLLTRSAPRWRFSRKQPQLGIVGWETLQIFGRKVHQEENLCAWNDLECYTRSTEGKDLSIALVFPLILSRSFCRVVDRVYRLPRHGKSVNFHAFVTFNPSTRIFEYNSHLIST